MKTSLMRWSPLFWGLAFPRSQKRGLTQCQPCDRPNPSQTNPFFEKGAPHPARARGARRLAILGSSHTHNAGDTTLWLGPRDPTLILDFEISPTCKFKPDRSGYALNPLKPGHGKLSGQQQPCSSCCSTPTSPTIIEPGHSVPDNGMEWTSGRSTFQVRPELETNYNRPLGAEHYIGPLYRVSVITALSPPTSHVLLQ